MAAPEPEIPVLVPDPDRIVVNMPAPAQRRDSQAQKWLFQRATDRLQELETRAVARVNGSAILLSLTYSMLFAVAVARIAIYVYALRTRRDELETSDQAVVGTEVCLSLGWMVYSAYQYISRLRLVYVENVRWASLLYVIFCIQYFSLSYWAAEIVYGELSYATSVAIAVLFVLYGFVTERSPNLLVLTVYFTLAFFLIEGLVRLLLCKCYNPWIRAGDEQQFVRKELELLSYEAARFQQVSCAICLRDFVPAEKVCQLPCHATHVFHAECLHQWLSRNNFCPFCRAPVTDSPN